jgi:hypothetical protein
MPPVKTRTVWFFVASALSACGGDTPQRQLPMTQPTPVNSTPAPAPSTGNQLSGTVIEQTPSGGRAVTGGTVFFWPGSRPGGQVAVNGDGKFSIPNLDVAVRVRLVWLSPGSDDKFQQAAPANVTIEGPDTHRDIQVARIGSGEFRCASPVLSGTVFENTPDGRRPLAHTRVLYAVDAHGFDAYTETDTQGRYTLCDLPPGTGQVEAGDCNDAVFPVAAEIRGDTAVDVDLTAFYASCPGAVAR